MYDVLEVSTWTEILEATADGWAIAHKDANGECIMRRRKPGRWQTQSYEVGPDFGPLDEGEGWEPVGCAPGSNGNVVIVSRRWMPDA